MLILATVAMLVVLAGALGYRRRRLLARRASARAAIDLRDAPTGPRRVLLEDAGL